MSYIDYINCYYWVIQVWRIEDKIVKSVEGAMSPAASSPGMICGIEAGKPRCPGPSVSVLPVPEWMGLGEAVPGQGR